LGFLAARTTDEVELVWERDDAIDSEGGECVPLRDAKIRKNKKPDRFVVRPLSNRELFSIGTLSSTDMGLALAAVECCTLATVRIHRSDGSIVKDDEDIRSALDTSAPPDFISSYAQAIYAITVPEDLADAGTFRDDLQSK